MKWDSIAPRYFQRPLSDWSVALREITAIKGLSMGDLDVEASSQIPLAQESGSPFQSIQKN